LEGELNKSGFVARLVDACGIRYCARCVDIFDIVIVAAQFGRPPPPIEDLRADLDINGVVDIFDIVVVALNFGATG